MAKTLKNFRLTNTAIGVLAIMAEQKGVSEAAVVEMMIRDKGEASGITPEEAAKAFALSVEKAKAAKAKK